VTPLGSARFLDIKPADAQLPDALDAHLLPLHSFWRMEIATDTLTLRTLNQDWFKEMAGKKRLPLAYVKAEEDTIVLTAPTASLRDFFKRYGNVAEMLSQQKYDFHRQK
jgi:hypothetical protein